MTEPADLDVTSASLLMEKGKLTAEALMASCLARVDTREDAVRAWAYIDADLAMAAARACDRETRRGPLHGIPIGVKDIIDTSDMPTAYGSPIYNGNQPAADAACVALAREAGAVIMGKTVSTEFATRHPGKTRNPHNAAHTPGGSSSGSAAAVADRMVPAAFGTQTTGSVIRPSAYCGIVGYKPTFGTINRTGVKPLSDTMDTVGLHARSVPDIALILSVISGRPYPGLKAVAEEMRPWRIGICRTPYWDRADAATHALLEQVADRLGRAGSKVRELVLPEPFSDAFHAQDVINEFDTWRALAFERTRHPEKLSTTLSERLARAGRRSAAEYTAAHDLAAKCRGLADEMYSEWDALIVPAAPGEAPNGLGFTGDPIFSQLWTLLHGPAVTIPAGHGPSGLPLGIQLVGARGHDLRVLACANWVAGILAC
jgi:amidase